MKAFYFESGLGCGIREYTTLKSAERGILKEVGTYNGAPLVREATLRDAKNVRAMGGAIPDALLAELEKKQ